MSPAVPILGEDREGGKDVEIDVGALAAGRLLISAQSGAGKSWALRRLLEQTYGLLPQIVLDREGEFYTLREKGDYLLAGGEEGDCPAVPRSAALLARRILELQLSAIVDLEPLDGPERFEFVRRFLKALVEYPRKKRSATATLVVLDEADQFAPQTGKPESRGAVINLASIGRKRGLVGCFATQRLAKLSKDVAAECANRLIGRTTLANDVQAAVTDLGFSKRDWSLLRRLQDGEFYAYGPALSQDVRRVKVGPVETTHHRPGQPVPPTPAPRAAVKRVLAELADLPERAAQEAATLDQARREIAGLRRELRAAQKSGVAPDEAALERARSEGARAAQVELQRVGQQTREVIGTLNSRHRQAGGALETVLVQTQKALDVLRQPVEIELPAASPAAPRRIAPTASSEGPRPAPTRAVSGSSDRSLPAGERKILVAVAQHEGGVTRQQLTVLTGYKRSTRDRTLQYLQQKGLVVRTPHGDIEATPEGLDTLGGDFEPLPKGEALRAHWLKTLPRGEATILRMVIDAYPDRIPREEIGEETGYKRSTRDRTIQYLQARRLVVSDRSGVGASPDLFS